MPCFALRLKSTMWLLGPATAAPSRGHAIAQTPQGSWLELNTVANTCTGIGPPTMAVVTSSMSILPTNRNSQDATPNATKSRLSFRPVLLNENKTCLFFLS
ncbi:hypothetical protein DM01DRAFT_1410288, partial [Hesseltinella vesiculosa]